MARPSLEGLPKFKALVRRLAIPKPYVRGLLETLWDSCHTNGDPRLGTPDEVEAAAEWPGQRGEFFEALRERWLDELPEEPGIYHAHDYWHHAPKYAKDRALREAERVAAGVTISDLRREAGRLGGLAKASKAVANGSDLPQHYGEIVAKPSKRLAKLSTPAPVSERDIPTSIPQVEGRGSAEGAETARSAPQAAPPGGDPAAGVPGYNGHRAKKRDRAAEVLTYPPRLLEAIPDLAECWAGRMKHAKRKVTISAQNDQLAALVPYLDTAGVDRIREHLATAGLGAWQGICLDRLSRNGSGHDSRPRSPAHLQAGLTEETRALFVAEDLATFGPPGRGS